MTFLPIVDRELRVAARLRRTYWIRVAAALVGLLIAGWMLLTSRLFGGAGMIGRLMFDALNGVAYLYCLLGGIFKTADCLSEEKREGTLGLLFLTDLKGYDIVLGKITATSLHWFFGLLAIFPMLAVSMLAGGVMAGEFWRTLLALANALFFSLATGMLVSSFSRNERVAALGTVLLLFLLGAVPAGLAEWHQDVTGANQPSPWFRVAWPGHAHDFAADGFYLRSAKVFWNTLLVSHLTGWVMLGLGSVILRRAWQEKAATARGSRWQERRQRWRFGAAKARAVFRQRLLAVNPVYWLGSRDRRKRQWVYAALVLGTGYFVGDMLVTPNDWADPMSFLMPAFWLQAGLKIWIAFESCRRFVDDRRSGAMELMLVAPLTVRQILRGQWQALWRQFGGAVAALFFFDLFLVWGGLNAFSSASFVKRSMFLSMFTAGVAVFLLDVWALAWIGMRLGMMFRHAYVAGGLAIGMILAAPWVLFYIGLTGVMMAVMAWNARGGGTLFGTSFEWLPEVATAGWFLVSLAVDLSLGLWARRTLFANFRALAAKEKKFLVPASKFKAAPVPDNIPPPVLNAPR